MIISRRTQEASGVHSALQASIDNAIAMTPAVRWSISIRDKRGEELASHDSDAVLSTASIGKVLLLAEVAHQYEAGSLLGTELLHRTADIAVGDAGLWQHLQVETLSVEDIATLVASTSDNLATNVLLKRVGLSQVQELGRSLGLTKTTLLDRVRDQRSPEDPPGLSTGSAGELSDLMHRISNGSAISPFVSKQLEKWLSRGGDLSMVPSSFGFDPLAHVTEDRGFLVRNKTGNDTGVRADVGFLSGSKAILSYAAIANWKDSHQDSRDLVMTAMQNIGKSLRVCVEQ